MAWTETTVNDVFTATETVTLASSTTTEYFAVIDFLQPFRLEHRDYVEFVLTASAVSGSNLDIGLHGSFTEAGTVKNEITDALVTDVTNGTKVQFAARDVSATPFPYYFISITTDANESANTLKCEMAY